MTAKEYLKQLRKMEIVLRQQRQEVSRLRSDAASLKSIDYSKDKVKSSAPRVSAVELAAESIAAASDEYARQIAEVAQWREAILAQIQGLDNTMYIEILYKRYVEYKDFDTIAAELSYSTIHVKRVHGYALLDFTKRYLADD